MASSSSHGPPYERAPFLATGSSVGLPEVNSGGYQLIFQILLKTKEGNQSRSLYSPGRWVMLNSKGGVSAWKGRSKEKENTLYKRSGWDEMEEGFQRERESEELSAECLINLKRLGKVKNWIIMRCRDLHMEFQEYFHMSASQEGCRLYANYPSCSAFYACNIPI